MNATLTQGGATVACPYCQAKDQRSGDFCNVCCAELAAPLATINQPLALEPAPIDDIGADELSTMDLPPALPIVAGIIPRGLTVLAGRPKAGKSFIVYDLALAVASGRPWNGQAVEQGRVLYLAMEDTRQRLQARLRDMTDAPPAALRVATMCDSGLPGLEAWIVANPGTRLIVIDTMQKWRKGKAGSYSRTYHESGQLKELADKHNLAVVVLHHTTKLRHANPLDSIMGDTGLTASADGIIVLMADDAGRGALWITGRDLPRTCLPMTFSNSRWQIVEKRKAIAGPAPMPAITVVPEAVETHRSEFSFGIMPGEPVTVKYVRSLHIGIDAARAALRANGCVRMGDALGFMSEKELIDKFTRVGWIVSGRLRECETVQGAVSAGHLVMGRPA